MTQATDFPTGLDLGKMVPPQEALAQASLPAFGSLCSRAALRMGLDSMALASAGQKPWLAAAQRTLAAMAEGGAPVGSYRFIARDERRAMALMDQALAILKNDHLDYNDTLLTNTEQRATLPKGRRRRFSAASFQDKSWGATFDIIAAFFDDPAHVRAQGIGHEFGHAWQSATGRPIHAAIVEGQPGPVAAAMRARATRLAQWQPGSPDFFISGSQESSIAEKLSQMIEESVCDAIGCWAAQRAYGARVLGPVEQFRMATLPDSDPAYSTAWLMRMLNQRHPEGLPDTFADMVASIEACAREVAPILTGNGKGHHMGNRDEPRARRLGPA